MAKHTGIVRRVDDLGRVEIPKELRRAMRINEGDSLEIFSNKDGSVTFKPYKTITTLKVYYTIEKEIEIDVDTAEIDLDKEAEVMAFVNDKIPSKGDEGDVIELCGVWEGDKCLYEW